MSELREVVAEYGLPQFAAGQIARWIYVRHAEAIDLMTDLPKRAREQLSQRYIVGIEPPEKAARSVDGTIKYLFSGTGGRDVEAVYIPDRDRATLCVSSQAGCRMGCTFCMTGRNGFNGDLDTHRIINQIMSIPERDTLTNIVFMGMGEPMDNLGPVLGAIGILTEPWGMAWSPRRITVSSVGKIRELSALLETTKVNVAVSVHSPYAEERAGLMPVERAYPIRKVVDMLRGYDFAHQRRLSMEYIMWRGINDDMRHADALAKLIRGTSARVNLIRFHAIPGVSLKPCGIPVMEAFRDRLNTLGITATIRASRGEDIMAACGMLAGKKDMNKE